MSDGNKRLSLPHGVGLPHKAVGSMLATKWKALQGHAGDCFMLGGSPETVFCGQAYWDTMERTNTSVCYDS